MKVYLELKFVEIGCFFYVQLGCVNKIIFIQYL